LSSSGGRPRTGCEGSSASNPQSRARSLPASQTHDIPSMPPHKAREMPLPAVRRELPHRRYVLECDASHRPDGRRQRPRPPVRARIRRDDRTDPREPANFTGPDSAIFCRTGRRWAGRAAVMGRQLPHCRSGGRTAGGLATSASLTFPRSGQWGGCSVPGRLVRDSIADLSISCTRSWGCSTIHDHSNGAVTRFGAARVTSTVVEVVLSPLGGSADTPSCSTCRL
jgi:hypothetical protein